MNRTDVAREVRDQLHATEAAMEAMIVQTEATLARMVSAKTELGLTGTMGDTAIARMRETLAALHGARESLMDSHGEAYVVLKAAHIRGVASVPTFGTGLAEQAQAA